MSNETIHYDIMQTPIGQLLLAADHEGLRCVWFETARRPQKPSPNWVHSPKALALARTQLDEYFAGARRVFDLPLHPLGTPFQMAVWRALEIIPYGVTISYGELARRIEQPQAVRAAGAANGSNPLPIVIPCHRVIGSNGSLTGFGGGLPTKRFLLSMEERVAHGDLFA
ncbi:methylated-DNA--[protein]-cysteine S-methyltransferase [Rhodanobacter sp. L36]|uniref:methylated-DNA--[protein]-cysteine S-methyltransferase n=1 Tax=Rhodanobacter sp. L36 TaxID=1747221 RepID=UPI00131AF997|nr:methylated-DNA--[protein]-cysteine S-methyltransferase [Rhodanobacter sp. L36]